MRYLPGMTGIGLGLILGAAHATDADHLVALTGLRAPMERGSSVLRLALSWAAGHGAAFLALAIPITLLGFEPPPLLERLATVAAGALLILLGTLRLLAGEGKARRAPRVAPGLAGIVHGLGGSSAIALLAMASYPARGERAAFLVSFVLATALSMAVLTVSLSALLERSRALERLALRIVPFIGIALGVRLILTS